MSEQVPPGDEDLEDPLAKKPSENKKPSGDEDVGFDWGEKKPPQEEVYDEDQFGSDFFKKEPPPSTVDYLEIFKKKQKEVSGENSLKRKVYIFDDDNTLRDIFEDKESEGQNTITDTLIRKVIGRNKHAEEYKPSTYEGLRDATGELIERDENGKRNPAKELERRKNDPYSPSQANQEEVKKCKEYYETMFAVGLHKSGIKPLKDEEKTPLFKQLEKEGTYTMPINPEEISRRMKSILNQGDIVAIGTKSLFPFSRHQLEWICSQNYSGGLTTDDLNKIIIVAGYDTSGRNKIGHGIEIAIQISEKNDGKIIPITEMTLLDDRDKNCKEFTDNGATAILVERRENDQIDKSYLDKLNNMIKPAQSAQLISIDDPIGLAGALRDKLETRIQELKNPKKTLTGPERMQTMREQEECSKLLNALPTRLTKEEWGKLQSKIESYNKKYAENDEKKQINLEGLTSSSKERKMAKK